MRTRPRIAAVAFAFSLTVAAAAAPQSPSSAPEPVLGDVDQDGIADTADNCPRTRNFFQEDSNGDGAGDACQPRVEILRGVPGYGGWDPYIFFDLLLFDPDGQPVSGRVEVLEDPPSQTVTLSESGLPLDCSRVLLLRPYYDERPFGAVALVEDHYALYDAGFLGSSCGQASFDYGTYLSFARGSCDALEEEFGDAVFDLFDAQPPFDICVADLSLHVSQTLRIEAIASDYSSVTLAQDMILDSHAFAGGDIPDNPYLPFGPMQRGYCTAGEMTLRVFAEDGETPPVIDSFEFFYGCEDGFYYDEDAIPVAAAGPDRTLECDASGMAIVPLDGSGSSDADSTPGTHDDLVAFEWLEDLGLATQRLLGTTETLEVRLGGGVHAISLRVTDAAGGTATDEAVVSLPCAPPSDGDGDGIADAGDNCPGSANPGQQDADGDGAGDACDPCTDTDGDGYGDPEPSENLCPADSCPAIANPDQSDADRDGTGDACDALVDRWIFQLSSDAASAAPGDRVEFRYLLVNNTRKEWRGVLAFLVTEPPGRDKLVPGSLLCAGGNPRMERVAPGGLLEAECFVDVPAAAEPGRYRLIGRFVSRPVTLQDEIAIDLVP